MLYTVFAPVVVSARIAAFCGEHGSHWALFIVIFRGGGFVVLYFPAIRGFVKFFFQKIYCSAHKSQRGATLEKFFAIFLFLYMQRLWTFTSARDVKEEHKKNGQSKRGEGEGKDVQKEIWSER
jgi:hypothetical protein